MNLVPNGFMAGALMLFLLVNVAVGIYYGRNIKTIKEYALGGRNFSTAVLVSTIVGTFIGGDYLFITSHEVYTTGWHYAIACMGMVLYLLIVSYFFIPRMGEFLGSMSVADAMGKIYGKHVRIISAFAASIGSIGYIAAQFKVLSAVFGHAMDLSNAAATIAAAVVVISYSAMGGMRAIVLTDLVQFFTFLVVIPIVAVGVSKYYFDNNVALRPKSEIFDIKNFLGIGNTNFWEMIGLFLIFATPEFDPALFQRISIGKTVRQVQKAFYISSIILLFLLIVMSIIGFFVHSINPYITPTEGQEEYAAIYYVMDNYAGIGVITMLLMGVAAMSMSTADSNLNALSTIITHDLLYQFKTGMVKNRQLLVSKFVNVLLGAIGVFLALNTGNMLDVIFTTHGFYLPVVTTPLVFTILGFRSTSKSVIVGMICGVIVVIAYNFNIVSGTDIEAMMSGTIASTAAIFASHYLLKQKGGWVGIKDETSYRAIYIKRHGAYKAIRSAIKDFDFMLFCRENAPSSDFSYMGLGIFSLMSLIATIYAQPKFDSTALEYICDAGLFISFAYVSYPIWPLSIKSELFMQTTWHLMIFILLPLFGCLFLLRSEFDTLQSMIFATNIFVTLFLIPSGLGIFMIIAGAWFGCSLFESIYGASPQIPTGTTDILVYLGMALSVIFIVFVRPKVRQEKMTNFLNETLEQKVKDQSMDLMRLGTFKEEFISRLEKYCIDMFYEMEERARHLAEKLSPSLADKKAVAPEDMEEIVALSEKIVTGSEYLLDVISRTEQCFKIHLDTKNAEDFCAELMSNTQSMARGATIDYKFDLKDEIECDHENIGKVVLGFISHGLAKNTSKTLPSMGIAVKKGVISYDLSFSKSLKEYRDALDISVRFKNLKIDPADKKKIIQGDFGLEFSYWMKIVFSHYGKVSVVFDGDDLVYNMTIPLRLSDTRPKKMDIPDQLEEFFKLMYSNIQDSNKAFQENAQQNLRSMGIEEEVIRKAFYKT